LFQLIDFAVEDVFGEFGFVNFIDEIDTTAKIQTEVDFLINGIDAPDGQYYQHNNEHDLKPNVHYQNSFTLNVDFYVQQEYITLNAYVKCGIIVSSFETNVKWYFIFLKKKKVGFAFKFSETYLKFYYKNIYF